MSKNYFTFSINQKKLATKNLFIKLIKSVSPEKPMIFFRNYKTYLTLFCYAKVLKRKKKSNDIVVSRFSVLLTYKIYNKFKIAISIAEVNFESKLSMQ